MAEGDLARLEAILNDMECDLRNVRATVRKLREEPGPAAPVPSAAPPPPPPVEAPVAPSEQKESLPPPAPLIPAAKVDIESLIGSKWLLYVGALLLVIGVASFLKIAFDRDWIGPAMRVAMGIAAGVAVIGLATAVRRRLAPYFADALVGIGAAIEYISFFSAGSLFHVMSLGEIMAGMILVTTAVGVLAYRGNRQPLAYVSLAGGLLTPLLAGSNNPDSLLLFVYLAVLAAFAVALGELRRWTLVPCISLAGTIVYWVSFGYDNAAQHPTIERVAIALLLYAVFASTALIAWSREEDLDPVRLGVTLVSAVWFMVAISTIAADARALLAATLLLVAAAHVSLSYLTKQRQQLWLATLALALAIPSLAYSFSGAAPDMVLRTASNIGWIALGTVACVIGLRKPDGVLAAIGILAYLAALLQVAIHASDGVEALIFNDRFISLVACAVGLSIVLRSWRRTTLALSERVRSGVVIVIDAALVAAISPEAWHIGQSLAPAVGDQAGAAGISIGWALFGATLVVLGIRFGESTQRWAGLVLLGGTAIKVFLYDLVGLDIVFRVFSALILGLVFIVIAYLYQRRQQAAAKE